MPEIRFEAAADDVAILDGFCSATGRCRTEVIKEILNQWSVLKLREAETILRVAGSSAFKTGTHAGRNPGVSASDSDQTGKGAR